MKVRIWDLPTRLFHLALILSLFGSFASIYLSDDLIVWHARCGLFFLALILFRLIWGFVGGHWSRFSNFTPSWNALRDAFQAQLKGQIQKTWGHNPLGSLAIWAILLLFFLQVLSGLGSDDDVAFSGPLTRFMSESQVDWATWYHTDVGQWAIIALVSLHVLVVYWHRLAKADDLITPMITGDKTLEPTETTLANVQESQDSWASRCLALVIFVLLLALVFGGISL